LDFIEAAVPGAVQYDLVSAGLLENPYRSSEAAFSSAWVAKSDWLYRNEFDLEGGIPKGGKWLLKVDGVDTFSEVWLNKILIGETRNNYRWYEYPIEEGVLRDKANVLEVRVKAHHRMVSGKVDEALKKLKNPPEIEGLLGKSLIRRYQRSFFSGSSLLNLGTGVLGIGINRLVSLHFHLDARITDLHFRTLSIEGGKALCEIHAKTDGPDRELRVSLTEPATGEPVFSYSGKTESGAKALSFEIASPQLWWPAGYGKAGLYDLKASIYDESGALSHEVRQQAGIKTVKLVEKLSSGRSAFHFIVNGKKIWVRGQNPIPLDYIKVYGAPEEYERLFRMLESSKTNLIRIWGGGMPCSDEFFSQCDRLGIMVWSEGFLHSNVYPDYDADFVKEYIEESREVLEKARRHPCLSVICGGNEQIEGWEEYGWQGKLDKFYGEELFRTHMPIIASELCPEIPYIINSPHGGADSQSPVEGECHNWGSFYNAFKDPLFVSETCWSQESYSRPETLEKYMGIDVDSYAGQGWLERWSLETSRPRIGRLAYSSWPHGELPCLRDYLRTLDLEQACADSAALKQFRLRSPSNSGVIYWSFNKGGPLFQFGCVDYGGYPLRSFYAVSRVFAPIAVGLFRDGEEIYAAVSNQSGKAFEGRLEIAHLTASGENLDSIAVNVSLEDGQSKKVFSSDSMYQAVISRVKEVFFARLENAEGIIEGEDILFVCPFAEFEQEECRLSAAFEEVSSGIIDLELESDAVIRQLAIEANQKILCSDNYFPMAPGKTKKVRVEVLEWTKNEKLALELATLEGLVKVIL
jgi:beta-mannosidase